MWFIVLFCKFFCLLLFLFFFLMVLCRFRSEVHTSYIYFLFFFNDPATTEIYTLSLHDALPIYLRPRTGRVARRPCRVRGFLGPVTQNSVDPAAARLRPSAALHSPSSCARQLLFRRGRSWLLPLPRRWAFPRMQNPARAQFPGPWPYERGLPGRTGQTARAIRLPKSGSSYSPHINSPS